MIFFFLLESTLETWLLIWDFIPQTSHHELAQGICTFHLPSKRSQTEAGEKWKPN